MMVCELISLLDARDKFADLVKIEFTMTDGGTLSVPFYNVCAIGIETFSGKEKRFDFDFLQVV